MLNLVSSSQGQNRPKAHMTAQRAQYEGKVIGLTRLYQGVYCNEEDLEDLPGFMKRNALRIANYLFRGSTLSHSSAYFKGAVEHEDSLEDQPKFKLFLAGSYAHKIGIKHLEIVQNDSMLNGRIAQFCQPLADNKEQQFGPMYLTCLNDEVVYLQQFGRKRYNLERFLSPSRMDELRAVLIERHGDKLAGRLRTVADEVSDFGMELDGALSHLREWVATQRLGIPSSFPAAANAQAQLQARSKDSDGREEEVMNNVFEFSMGWYGRPIGRIVNNGVAWNFSFDDGWMLPLSVGKNRPGTMPPFVQNLFPEGYLLDAMNDLLGSGTGLNATVLSRSERYLSNISIVQDRDRLERIPVDVLSGRLDGHTNEIGLFQGTFSLMPNTSPEFIGELNRLLTDMGMPRQSGAQPKIPCHLDEEGTITPALNQPFTHILKLAGLYKDPHHLRGVVEWASMSLARGGGLKTCDFALLEMDNGVLGYICERFDIPTSDEDMRMIYAEDFCSVHSMGPMFKMMNDNGLDDLLGAYKKFATPNRQDAEQLFRLVYTNYLLENGDFHLKNASLLRVASPTLDGFRSTRLSPAYDIMNTRFFSDFKKSPDDRETMILDLKGKNVGFTLDDYVTIGGMLDIDPERTEQLMWETAHGIAETAQKMADGMMELLEGRPKAKEVIAELLQRAVDFCRQDFTDIPALQLPASSLVAAGPSPAEVEDDEPDLIRQVRRALRSP